MVENMATYVLVTQLGNKWLRIWHHMVENSCNPARKQMVENMASYVLATQLGNKWLRIWQTYVLATPS